MLVLILCTQKWGGPSFTLIVFLTAYSLPVPLYLLYHIRVHCRIINNPVITPPFPYFLHKKRQGQKINLILCTLSLLTFYLHYLRCQIYSHIRFTGSCCFSDCGPFPRLSPYPYILSGMRSPQSK